MSKCDITIHFDRSDRTYNGGDTVSGEVVVRVNQDISCNGIVLQHYWGTHGRGNKTTGTKHEIRLCETQPLQAGEELRLPFEFTTELWPLTYRGNYINVDHYVHVAVDVPWAIDPKHSEEFIVLPGECPPQFTGDRSEVVELKDETVNATDTGIMVKIILVVVVLVLLSILAMFAAILLPIAAISGAIYWIRKKAIAGRVGDVEFESLVKVVSSGETWPCKLSFTPRKTFRINEISARLLVQEAATSGSGTNSTTHRHTLFDQKEVIRPAGQLTAGEPFSEEILVPLPECDAWSLDVSDNKVEWTIDVRIDIPRFPDWSEKSTLQMIPVHFLDQQSDTHSAIDRPAVAFEDLPQHIQPDEQAGHDVTPSTLYEVISAVTNADRYGNERSLVISAAAGQTFNVAIIVDRVSTTLGLSGEISQEHQQGRTILGTVAGTDQEAQLFTRHHNNAAVDAIARDEVWEAQVTVDKWDSLYNRLVMLEV